MRIGEQIKNTKETTINWVKLMYQRLSHWIDRNYGPDRLTFQPRIIKGKAADREMLNELKKLYRSHNKTNISITGGKSAGKKSFLKTFENGRLLSFRKFIHVDFLNFVDKYQKAANSNSLLTSLDLCLYDNIISRAHQGELPGLTLDLVRGSKKVYRKPLNIIVGIAIMVLIFTNRNQIIDDITKYLPDSWDLKIFNLVFSVICIGLIVLSCLRLIKIAIAFWPLNRLKIKFVSKNSEIDFAVDDNNIGSTAYQNKIIYALTVMRWEIGHTVVFENMEALGEEAFLITISHLCALNRKINENLTAWKLWNVARIKSPIRFIYIFRDDIVQPGLDKPSYDDMFYILPSLTANNAFYELEKAFNAEISNGADFPVDKLFPIDPNYEINVSRFLADRRILNITTKRSIQRYRDLAKRIQPELPTENDVHGLFSFALYSVFFQKDCSKFADNTSVVFTKSSNREDIDPKYIDLFEYLISDNCPKEYRITYLSMRFVSLQPELKSRYLEAYKTAYTKKDYYIALKQLEKAICCDPNNELLLNEHEDILQIINNENQSATTV